MGIFGRAFRLPWFRLRTAEGDELSGKILRIPTPAGWGERKLRLRFSVGWAETDVLLSDPEVEALLVWLTRTYKNPTPEAPRVPAADSSVRDRLAKVLPLLRPASHSSGDPVRPPAPLE